MPVLDFIVEEENIRLKVEITVLQRKNQSLTDRNKTLTANCFTDTTALSEALKKYELNEKACEDRIIELEKVVGTTEYLLCLHRNPYTAQPWVSYPQIGAPGSAVPSSLPVALLAAKVPRTKSDNPYHNWAYEDRITQLEKVVGKTEYQLGLHQHPYTAQPWVSFPQIAAPGSTVPSSLPVALVAAKVPRADSYNPFER
ncbi:hypothetical protein A4X09_0g4134 [Tilletia walkeri]|uniref:Uncharacterized protein n=1 Tax=Tilletia walkeri TaxID=117179 RepID=A0A8X7N9X9_9BASI|nr:hypothetical protein A4X09_0g4134 [Tilletia walkeri]